MFVLFDYWTVGGAKNLRHSMAGRHPLTDNLLNDGTLKSNYNYNEDFHKHLHSVNICIFSQKIPKLQKDIQTAESIMFPHGHEKRTNKAKFSCSFSLNQTI